VTEQIQPRGKRTETTVEQFENCRRCRLHELRNLAAASCSAQLEKHPGLVRTGIFGTGDCARKHSEASTN
jgi:hypothetical protein